MTILYLRPAKKQKPEPDVGAEIAERFVGNMPIALSTRFQIVGGAWVEPRSCAVDEDLSGLVGIAQTHEKLRLVSKVTGHVMKI
jgi:hypothetical protein